MNARRRSGGGIAIGLALLFGVACAGADVVINEVAWGGTAASSSDEWIELLNTTDEPIDLVGWTLVFGETTIHLGAVDGSTREIRRTTVEDGGYVLLERSDDGTVSDIVADVLYVGSLPNTGVVMELRNAAGELVDRIEVAETGWPAGVGGDGEPPYASMERIDPEGDVLWATHDGAIRNGADANGEPINGTPGRENGARILARTAPRVRLISPIVEGSILSGIVIVEWTADDPDGAAEALGISIDVSLDDGETWDVVSGNLANGGSYAWDTTMHPDGDAVRVRVIAVDADGRSGAVASPRLTIRNGDG